MISLDAFFVSYFFKKFRILDSEGGIRGGEMGILQLTETCFTAFSLVQAVDPLAVESPMSRPIAALQSEINK